MEWMCETEKCLVDEELLENLLQSQNYLSWTPMNYSQFWGRTLREGQNGKLGTQAPMVSNFWRENSKIHFFAILFIATPNVCHKV